MKSYVHTPTKESCLELLQWCEQQQIKWQCGSDATDKIRFWDTNREETVLLVGDKEHGLLYGNKEYNISKGRTLVSVEDFLRPATILPSNWPF